MSKRIAIYPGSFDPITFGHIDIIKRATMIFDEILVAVALNLNKTPLFNEEERVIMISECVKEMSNVRVDSFNGLLVDYALEKKAQAVIRGLRAVSDFEYEMQMALVNRKLDENLIMVFLMPHENYSYLNSTIVKELARLGGDISSFVPSFVKDQLLIKLRCL
jgi:pantetheine-phosphate adenylyltransferase